MSEVLPGWAKTFPPENPLKVTKLMDGLSSHVVLNIQSNRNHITIGRAPDNDILIDEISCSRKHAIICYGDGPTEDGFDFAAYWVCDLGTQNGSRINDQMLMEPKKFYPLKSGYFFQFGISTTKFLFEYEHDINGVDVESFESVKPINEPSNFTDWGQKYEIESENPSSKIINNDPAPAVDNPVQVVKNYFKREGYDFNPEFVQLNTRFHKVIEATLVLPIEDANNEESNSTALSSQGDSKHEALHKVCKLAYELLYSQDLLNKQVSESYINRKKRQLMENDYYDSDEDTFYDRTGSIEHKRDRRIQQNKASNPNAAEEFVVSSSSNYKSYFDKSSKYIPSKKINSRLSELNMHLIRAKSELQRTKNKTEQFVIDDAEDEIEKHVSLSEKNQLLGCISALNDKVNQLTKEREFLNGMLKYSKEIESNPELLESFTNEKVASSTSSKNLTSQQDNTIVNKIIQSYTHPSPVQKTSLIEGSCDKSVDGPKLKLAPKSGATSQLLDDASKNELSKNSNSEADSRDMVETEIEQLIDDSPISWTPQSKSTIKYQDSLKDKYGY